MMQLGPQAEQRLNEYLWQVKESLRGCTALDAAEVESDVRQHIERELQATREPVTLDALQAVLEQLGCPDQWSLEAERAGPRQSPQHLAGLNPLERIEVASNRFRRSLVVGITAFVASIFIFALMGHVADIAYPPGGPPNDTPNYFDRIGKWIEVLTTYPVLAILCPLLPVLVCLVAAHQYTDIDRYLPLRRFRIRPVLSVVGVPLLALGALGAILSVIGLIGEWDRPSAAKRAVRLFVGITVSGSVSLVPWLAYAYAFRFVTALLKQGLGAAVGPLIGRMAAWSVYAVGILLVVPLAYMEAQRFGNADGEGQVLVMVTAGLAMLILVAVGLADLLYGDVGWLAVRRPLPSIPSSRRFNPRPAE